MDAFHEDGVIAVKKVSAEELSKGGAVVLNQDGFMIDLVEKAAAGQVPANAFYNAGIYLLTPRIFTYTATLQKSPRGEYEFTDALKASIKAGDRLRGVTLRGEWADVRDPAVLAELNRPRESVAMNPDWEEAIEGCLGYLATEKSHALNTQLINRIALESFAAWMDKNHAALEPGLLVKGHIRDYLRAQRTEKRLAPSSMKIIVIALRHFFAHLKRENIIGHDLLSALDLPRLDRLLPEMLSEVEVDRLLSVELPDTPLGLRDGALLEVLYASGLRAGEIVGLRLENYLREEKLLRVIGKGNRERIVPVGEKAMAALDRWLAKGTARFWSSRRPAAKFSSANMAED